MDSPAPVKRKLYGREDYYAVYSAARGIIIRHKLLRIKQFELTCDGTRRLTICNLWRMERTTDSTLHLYDFDLKQGVWREIPPAQAHDHWPNIPFWPITENLDWARHVLLTQVMEAVLAAAGIRQFKLNGEESPSILRQLLLDKYTRVLSSKSLHAGARALRACLWEHIIDREVLSAMLAVSYRCTFHDYLLCARHRNGLLQVARERRNLLPLLALINPAKWERSDLFSRKLWVLSGRQSTMLQRYPLRPRLNTPLPWAPLRGSCAHYRGGKPYITPFKRHVRFAKADVFTHAAAWRWLSRAPVRVVRAWVEYGGNAAIITNLALANFSGRVPGCAYIYLLQQRRLPGYGVDRRIQTLYRIFLQQCNTLWKERGYAALTQWLRCSDIDGDEGNLRYILDYLRGEGFAKGLPDKHSTWTTLQRRSAEWHRAVAMRKYQHVRRIAWDSALPETVINGITFTPLTDTRALAQEAYEMKHCVSSYADLCINGTYRVFAVQDAQHGRSTLGLYLDAGAIGIDQHRGKYNGRVAGEVMAASEKLCGLYATALSRSKVSG